MNEELELENVTDIAYRLHGRIVDAATGKGVDAVRVELWDREGICRDLVAVAKTDEVGDFAITVTDTYLDSLFFARRPALKFHLFTATPQLEPPTVTWQQLEPLTVTWQPSAAAQRIRIAVDLGATREGQPSELVVRGRLTDSDGSPLVGKPVAAYDVVYNTTPPTPEPPEPPLLNELPLGNDTTDSSGQFCISYTPANGTHANLLVRATVTTDSTVAVKVCRAPATAHVDLVANNARSRGRSEVHRVAKHVESVFSRAVLIDPERVLELQEISTLIDLVACRTGEERDLVDLFVKAVRLEDEIDVDYHPDVNVALVYALLRQGLPQTRRELLSQRRSTLRRALEQAMGENIIPSLPTANIDDIIEKFVVRMAPLAAGSRVGGPSSLAHIFNGVELGGLEEDFARAVIEHQGKGTVDDFWTKLSAREGFEDPATIDKLKLVMQLGALTRYHAGLIRELASRFSAGTLTSIRDIAKYDKTDWFTIFDIGGEAPIGPAQDTPGTEPEHRRENYANVLLSTMEAAFPTAVIADRVIRDEVAGSGIRVFFEHNPNFEFGSMRVSKYLAETSGAMTGVSDVAATTERLKKMERIFHITPRHREMKPLLEADLHSAQRIHRMGKRRFVAKFGSEFGIERAEAIFGRACWIASASTALFAKYGSSFHGPKIATLPDLVTLATPNEEQNIADWTSLFGSLDGCVCEHCRSVYGPAAYLVDLLEFLDRHDSKIETPESTEQNPAYWSARDVLIGALPGDTDAPPARRPDIARLLLSCKNTDTTLPYIDLVNEILEAVVANELDGLDYLGTQDITSAGTPQELLAEPEVKYLAARNAAYAGLAAAVHPFDLPFHLWDEEARVYLEHLGVPRHELVEAMKLPSGDVSDQIARERLRMSKREWEIVTQQTSGAPTAYACWGMPEVNWVQKLAPVPRFLEQAGLSFNELRELLATKYVNPAASPTVKLNPETGCDIDTKLLDGLDAALLGRIHRFLRLRKRLGFRITELDWTLTSLGATDIDAKVVRDVAGIVALRKELDLPLPVLLSFWGNIGTRSSEEWGKSLYEELFLNKALTADPAFEAALGEPDPQNPLLLLNHAAGILAGLRISAVELALLVMPEVAEKHIGVTSPLTADALLTVENLSRLHRIVALARGLRLSIPDLLVLLSLSGLRALTVDSETLAVPATTRAFVELVAKVRRSRFSIAELHFLVRHAPPPGTQAALSDAVLQRIVEDIKAALDKVVAETVVVPDPEGDSTRGRLEELLAGETRAERAAKAEAIVAVINGRSALTRTEQRTLIDLHLTPFFGSDVAKAKDKLVGLSSEVGGPLLADVDQRFAYALAYLLNHQRRVRAESVVKQKLATEMKLDAEMVEHLLTEALGSFAIEAASAISDFLPEMNAAVEYVPPAVATEAQRQNAVRLLHKAALVIQRLKLHASELASPYPTDATLDLNTLLLGEQDADSDRQERFAKLLRLVDLASFRDTLRNGREDLLAIFAKSNAGQAAAFYDELSARTGWPRDGVEHLITVTFAFTLSDLRDEKGLLCLHRAFQLLGRLGASAAQGTLWADVEDATHADVALDIKRVARAKHDDARWSEVARPLRDVLREKQRNALVGYLVAKRDYASPNELFEDLLIDVEMSPCQLTSRIKQAISSVQTFVQRAFLLLEKDKVELDEEAAREWQWLKSYRVWEANRKVFLYPENWIEPELRDDKTPFFKTLESRLLQGEINAETAESAYLEYLESLHEVGRLDVAAMCHELEDDVDVLHVIARTAAPPHRYYYRKRIDSEYWTAWEKIDLDIPGDHLLATIWNRRLHLLWPIFEERADGTQKDDSSTRKYWRITLAWSELRDGAWGPIKTTANLGITVRPTIERKWISFMVESTGTDLTVTCLVNWYGIKISYLATYAVAGRFKIGPCSGVIEAASESRTFTKDDAWDEGMWFHGWAPEYATPLFMGLREIYDSDKALLTFYNEEEEVEQQGISQAVRLPMHTSGSASGDKWSISAPVLRRTGDRYWMLQDRNREFVQLSPHRSQESLFLSDFGRVFFMDLQRRTATAWKDLAKVIPNGKAPIVGDAANDLDEVVLEWANEPKLDLDVDYEIERFYRFHLFYHPYTCDFTRLVAKGGVDGLLRWSEQESPIQGRWAPIEGSYAPQAHAGQPFPKETVDFSYGGAYSQYNWELFFHAPFLIATRLSKNSRFEEADRWFRYIFDPTGGAPGDGPERYWYVRPFRENVDLASIQAQLEELSGNQTSVENPNAQLIAELFGLSSESGATQDMVAQIARWRETPFNPHLIARMRPLAYQKAVVMKYVENLLSWGDSLFQRDTLESINEATQLYILAAQILGERPRLVKEKAASDRTYADLEPGIDEFSNALVVESILPPPAPNALCTRREPPPALLTLYFCVPQNEKLLGLWDTVADRLFKIRHCMNIDGTVRQLPLFEPPIDPALLVQATAAGVDIGALLSDVNVPLPLYRFSVLQPKALEFTSSVIAMGGALLAALEKRDGETLSILRSRHELDVLTAVRETRKRQVDEAMESLAAIRRSRAVIEERLTFYNRIEYMIPEEEMQANLTGWANFETMNAGIAQTFASVLKLVPQITIGGPFPPEVKSEFGGVQLGGVLDAGAQFHSLLASMHHADASRSATAASYKRRWEEWKLQERLAQKELEQIDRQIVAGEIRLDIAKKELQNHELSVKNAKEVEEYLRTKHTNEELYDWMVSQASAVYFQGYKLAYELAKRAERAFQFELAQPEASYVQFVPWDSMKKGLMMGEKLQHDLRRMEVAYLEQNRREYEITKHVSLAEVAPLALLKLRETGQCEVELPEALFDQDWPGHYLRRIKSVSMTVPVVNGPYAGVNSKLTLLKSSVRMNSEVASTPSLAANYPRKTGASGPDARFLDHYGSIPSIVTSSGQSDAGLFELVFRDERYLPFEGAGSDSTWRMELDKGTNRFDPTAVHDVVLHVRYTAREGGENLKTAALNALGTADGPTGFRLFSAKTDFPDAWHVFITGQGAPVEYVLSLPLGSRLFQPLLGERNLEITRVRVFAKRSGGAATQLSAELQSPGAPFSGTPNLTLKTSQSEYGDLLLVDDMPAAEPILAESAPWKLKVVTLADTKLEDIWIVCEYQQQ
ncbi:hypothetical protein KEG38_30480 [Polyangium jinanense]|uniref:Tc toxin subunit A-related protein n=1 Tax=Polyangium jinanense TaxID=2829994 RepID=UPI00234021EB|nr:neuraminidase-like domain-containing protein [Polyangium jinanense]MDC3958225.1 hypothetical protein [Polyangium jinanense]